MVLSPPPRRTGTAKDEGEAWDGAGKPSFRSDAMRGGWYDV